MHKCPKCGAEIKGNGSFCTDCGAKLYLCPKCGAPYLPGDKFCDECGTDLVPKKTLTEQPVQVITQDNTEQQNKKNRLNIIIAVLLGVCLTLGGFQYYKHAVYIPNQEEAAKAATKAAEEAAAQKRVAETTKKQDAEKPPQPKTHGVIVGTYVYMREGPGTNYEALGYFYNGEEVSIIKITEDWYQVKRTSGDICWVNSQYCRAK